MVGICELSPPTERSSWEMVALIASKAPVGLLLQFLVPRPVAWPWYLWPTECCWTQTAAWPQKMPGRPGWVEPIQAQLKLEDLEIWGKVFVWESFGRCTCLIAMLNVKRVVKETDAEGPNFSRPWSTGRTCHDKFSMSFKVCPRSSGYSISWSSGNLPRKPQDGAPTCTTIYHL